MAGDGNGRPHGRIFFIVLGCLTFLASLAMIFASMALSFLGASFADSPGPTGWCPGLARSAGIIQSAIESLDLDEQIRIGKIPSVRLFLEQKELA